MPMEKASGRTEPHQSWPSNSSTDSGTTTSTTGAVMPKTVKSGVVTKRSTVPVTQDRCLEVKINVTGQERKISHWENMKKKVNSKADTRFQWKVNNQLHRNEKCSGQFYILWISVKLRRQLPDEIRANRSWAATVYFHVDEWDCFAASCPKKCLRHFIWSFFLNVIKMSLSQNKWLDTVFFILSPKWEP